MRRRLPRHDWAWHEAQMQPDEVWRCYRGVTGRAHYDRILDGKCAGMHALDSAPKRLRDLVHELDVNAAQAIWQREQVAAQQDDRCKHGRWRPKCAQCAWDASGRR